MDIKISLPLLPLRDIVVFPSMVIPLFVGRDKSISALNEVMKKEKKIIPDAYNNMYKGCPCVNIDEIFKKVSDSANPKLDIVIGKSNKADAKIAGITPAVFIFNGK